MAEVDDELRAPAEAYLHQERPGHTLQPTALVHGAYLRLALQDPERWNDSSHFCAPAAEVLAGQPEVAALAAAPLGGPWLAGLVRCIPVLALFTSISSRVMIGPRVDARMADDGVVPRRFGFRGHVPAQAIWLQVGLAILVLWSSGLRAQLTNLGWIPGLFTALSVIGSGILVHARIRWAQRATPPRT